MKEYYSLGNEMTYYILLEKDIYDVFWLCTIECKLNWLYMFKNFNSKSICNDNSIPSKYASDSCVNTTEPKTKKRHNSERQTIYMGGWAWGWSGTWKNQTQDKEDIQVL